MSHFHISQPFKIHTPSIRHHVHHNKHHHITNNNALLNNNFQNNTLFMLIILNGNLNHNYINKNNYDSFKIHIQKEEKCNLLTYLQKIYKQFYIFWNKNDITNALLYSYFIKEIIF